MYARNVATNLCVCLKASYEDTEHMCLNVHEVSGGVEQFHAFVGELRTALEGLEQRLLDMQEASDPTGELWTSV